MVTLILQGRTCRDIASVQIPMLDWVPCIQTKRDAHLYLESLERDLPFALQGVNSDGINSHLHCKALSIVHVFVYDYVSSKALMNFIWL